MQCERLELVNGSGCEGFFNLECYVICVCMTWSVQKGSLTNFFMHGDEVSMERERDLTICVCMVKANFVG